MKCARFGQTRPAATCTLKSSLDEITLDSLSKTFEYEKQVREIEDCDDIKTIKNICKAYIKLYLKQQEVVAAIGLK